MLLALYGVFSFIGLGYLAKSLRMVSNKQSGILLGFLLNFALPAQIFNGIYHIELDIKLILILLTTLSCSFVGGITMYFFAKKILKREKNTAVSMAFLSALGNTLFLGVPLVYGALGQEYSNKAILYDQICTAIPLAILTPLIMSIGGKGVFTVHSVTMRLSSNPLFLALIVGLVFKFMPFDISDWIFVPIKQLGACATPVALFAIGVQISIGDIKTEWKNTFIVLFWGMIIVPALVFMLIFIGNVEFTDTWRMALLESAMPPLISSAAVIMRAGLNNKIAVSSIAFGIFVSAITIPMWLWLSYL
ncbi:AEC family transporter [Helicobacter cappadocius]|uniref:AEC family transporter n=1 Tax=Helicobacter cappadocius TaxID=3063998 RepID=A0AA90PRK6_9HELI|nr:MULTISPECIES: AEC family transporter [unclassified Helicobacter]MDO7253822.1 AEC family transporter [Helicobacter sp. faydin-H75]MDP2539711.1 AEC family transporter [Helicobacter sp. faydin-H76]